MTMTPEQRAQHRAICDAATPGPWHYNPSTCLFSVFDEDGTAVTKENDAAFIVHARTALPAALDTLNVMEEALNGVNMIGVKLITERDHWKARAETETKRADEAEAKAEALERERDAAIKDMRNYGDTLCKVCRKYKNSCNPSRDELNGCAGFEWSGFQFDTARFTPA